VTIMNKTNLETNVD